MIELLNIPFKPGGRDKSGMDCWGLAMAAHRRLFNIELPDYGIDCEADRLINAKYLAELSGPEWVPVACFELPCLIAIRTSLEYPDIVTHVGVVIGDNKFLNINKKMNSYLERLDHPWFVPRTAGYYKYVG